MVRQPTVPAVSAVVTHACRKDTHLLRHTLATEMLRRGASLRQIALILRHRNIETTEIYARVDLDALRDLAQPWPGSRP